MVRINSLKFGNLDVRISIIPKILSWIPGLDIEAITFGHTIHIREDCYRKDVLLHEAIHYWQLQELGDIRYLTHYLSYLVEGFLKFKSLEQACEYIPFEKEARNNCDNIEYLKTRRSFQWVDYAHDDFE